MQVSASSKLVPVAHAAEIRPGSRGNLLRQLLSANVDADLYGKELVRAVINVRGWARCIDSLLQGVQMWHAISYFPPVQMPPDCSYSPHHVGGMQWVALMLCPEQL